jgi:hypothetical protein
LEASALQNLLVPNRECGACAACCIHPMINAPELKKPPGVVCQHCIQGGGCAIYNRRPSLCRAFFCAWRYLPGLDDQWRPDRCGILAYFSNDAIPPGYKGPAIRFELIGSLQSATWPPFVRYVGGLIENRVPVFLVVPGSPGYVSANTFLNEGLRAAVASHQLERVGAEIMKAAEACANHPKQKAVLN